MTILILWPSDRWCLLPDVLCPMADDETDVVMCAGSCCPLTDYLFCCVCVLCLSNVVLFIDDITIYLCVYCPTFISHSIVCTNDIAMTCVFGHQYYGLVLALVLAWRLTYLWPRRMTIVLAQLNTCCTYCPCGWRPWRIILLFNYLTLFITYLPIDDLIILLCDIHC